MTSKVYRATLIWFLEQLAAVEGGLCDEGIVVLTAELLAATRQRATDNTDGLELTS
jgi:hypothetical protein